MTKYLKIAYSIMISAYGLFILLGFMYQSFYIPGISDAPFYVFLAFTAPFLVIGLSAKFLSIKANTPRNDIPVNSTNIETRDVDDGENPETPTDPSSQTIKYTKNDWTFAVLSVLKVPLILAALFGGMYVVIIGIAYLLKHLNTPTS